MTFCGMVRLGHLIDDQKAKGYKTVGEAELRYGNYWVQIMDK